MKIFTSFAAAKADANKDTTNAIIEHYGSSSQTLSPYMPLSMFDGFESSRSHDRSHKEEICIQLSESSQIDAIEFEERHDDIEIYEQFEKNFIKEGLITSQPLDKTIRILKNRFNIKAEIMDDNEIVLSELEKPLDFYLPIINIAMKI